MSATELRDKLETSAPTPQTVVAKQPKRSLLTTAMLGLPAVIALAGGIYAYKALDLSTALTGLLIFAGFAVSFLLLKRSTGTTVQKPRQQEAPTTNTAAATTAPPLTTTAPYGSTPGQLRILTVIGIVAVLLPYGAVAWLAKDRTDVLNQLTQAKSIILSQRQAQIPTGFAAQCTSLAAAAGVKGNPNGAAEFLTTCTPGFSQDLLTEMVPQGFQLTNAVAYNTAPDTFAINGSANYFSILVSAQTREWTTDAASKTSFWSDDGMTYWRIAIWVDDDGHKTMRGPLKQVAPPTPADAPGIDAALKDADHSDPATGLVEDYLRRYYLPPPAGRAADGNVGQLLAPNLAQNTVHSEEITAVDVLKTSFKTDPTTGDITAVVLYGVTYRGGNTISQMATFTLHQQGAGRFLIANIAGAPPLAPN